MAKLRHVSLYTADPEKAAEFYEESSGKFDLVPAKQGSTRRSFLFRTLT